MKKYFSYFVMTAMMAVMIPLMASTADAQSQCYYNNAGQRICRNTSRNQGNVYDRHRNVINIGIGTAAGAIIGGLIGGKKGALIGTAAGAGGAALYTYKLNPKTKKYERVYRRR
ncbi:MAG TPA: hypothetical protein PKD26_15885 [Pyrinomonadaceae bacterium]|nr:hypothetical protein [Pyrinomonadaceae bacterium]